MCYEFLNANSKEGLMFKLSGKFVYTIVIALVFIHVNRFIVCVSFAADLRLIYSKNDLTEKCMQNMKILSHELN